MLKTYLKQNWLLLGFVVGFLLMIALAAGQIYHQDEYRWILEMRGIQNTPLIHPPLYLLLGRFFGHFFGFNHERWVPAIFGLANVFLVYLVSLALTRKKAVALMAAGLFVFNAYSLIAATQIDIDGAILPFFVLLTYLGYLRFLENSKRGRWLMVIGVVGGFFAKLSFAIILPALMIDWLWRQEFPLKELFKKYKLKLLGLVILLGGVYVLAQYFLPSVVAYATHFQVFDFRHRAYADLVFKIIKVLILAGPVLVFGGLSNLFQKQNIQKYLPLWLYLIFCFLFYAVVFDFSTLTIERYFMFMIAPLAILAAEPLTGALEMIRTKKSVLAGGVISLLAIGSLFISHKTLPLNPKSAYIHQLLSGRWNFLLPITGGSGPIGFYVSVLFTVLVWALVFISFLALRSKNQFVKALASTSVIIVGLCASGAVIEEFLFGGIYGSPNQMAQAAVNYVNSDPKINQVITYYDTASYNLRESGKYYSRFYTAPNRDYTQKLTTFRGYYMILDFPQIGSDNLYWKLLERCPIQKQFNDKKVSAYIFDCTKIAQ